MHFQREPVSAPLISEIEPLLQAHFEEISHYPDIPLQPNYDVYAALDKEGSLRMFTIRDQAEHLVGYCIYFLRHNLHYVSSKQASQDILFLGKEYRGSMVGYKFIKWCDEQLQTEGVQVVYQHVKAAHDFSPMLKRMGYELVDLIYAKRLDHE